MELIKEVYSCMEKYDKISSFVLILAFILALVSLFILQDFTWLILALFILLSLVLYIFFIVMKNIALDKSFENMQLHKEIKDLQKRMIELQKENKSKPIRKTVIKEKK